MEEDSPEFGSDDWIEAQVAKAIANMEREIAAGTFPPPSPEPAAERMKKLRAYYGPRYYNMDGKPIDMLEWAAMYERNNRHVGDTEVRFRGHVYRVSTVLLGLDHSFMRGGPPLIFETMVFEDGDMGGLDYMRRYSTKEQARRGHREAVRWLRGMIRETTMPSKPLIHNGHKP